MSKSPERYVPTPEDIKKAEDMMSERETELSDACESGYMTHSKEQENILVSDLEAKQAAAKVAREDCAQKILFEEVMEDIQRDKNYLSRHNQKDKLAKLLAKRDLLDKIVDKIQDNNLKKRLQDQIAHVHDHLDADYYTPEPLDTTEQAEIVLGEKVLGLKNILNSISVLHREAIEVGGMHSRPFVIDKTKYEELKTSLKDFFESVGYVDRFAKDNKISSWGVNNLVRGSAIDKIQKEIAWIEKPYTKGIK